ncbi:MAG: hypothetical protein HQL60_01550 [Magnetococcales bacterium]|nr:hypothetical protein [Magnetococcales bacterium]
MALSIQTNVAAIFAQRRLGRSNSALDQSFRRLSAEARASVVDDSGPGQSLVAGVYAEIRLRNQALRDINDGLSIAHVVDAATADSLGILNRLRELLVSGQEKGETFRQLLAELGRVSQEARFNGINGLPQLADGLQQIVDHARVDMAGESLGRDAMAQIGWVDVAELGLQSANTEMEAPEEDGDTFVQRIDAALSRMAEIRQKMQEIQNRFERVLSSLMTVSENVASARSRHDDTVAAASTSATARYSILNQIGTAIQAQANQPAQLVVQLLD